MGNSSETVDENVPPVVPATPNISNEFEKMLLKFPRSLFEEAVAKYEEKKASPPSKKRKKKKKFFHRVKRHRNSTEPSPPSSSDPSSSSSSSTTASEPPSSKAPSSESSSEPSSSPPSSESLSKPLSAPVPPRELAPPLPPPPPAPLPPLDHRPGRESKSKFYDLLSSVVHGHPCPSRFEDDYRKNNELPISTNKTKLSKQEKQAIAKMLKCRFHFPAEIITIEGKGTGVKTLRPLVRHQFICEYAGELITKTEALRREKAYAAQSTTRFMSCYMYYFEHRGQELCIDATSDGYWGIGRLINHSVDGNVDTVKLTVNGAPRLVFVANRDIKAGDELAYDYGDRTSIAAFPWLKK